MLVAKSIVFVPYIEPFVLVCFSQVYVGTKGIGPPTTPENVYYLGGVTPFQMLGVEDLLPILPHPKL